ncbi:MAG: chromate resistance protein ChrB domain-containing protein [Dermatophilaceae bacterium]
MRWATRAGVHVDRAACAWLIRRFVDPDAVFVFVDDPGDVPVDATPFDMRGVPLSHHHGQGPGKVTSQQVSRHVRARSGSRA